MKKFVTLLTLALAFSAPALAGDATAGKNKAATCAACHGSDGNSAAPTFPKLAGQNERYLAKQIMDIRDGRRPVPTMAGQVDNFTDEDVADVAAFYAAQAKSGSQAKSELVPMGEQIYRGGIAERAVPACSACHSPTGQGNGPAGFPSLAGQHAEYTATQLKAYRKGYQDETGRTNDGEGKIMRTIAFGLSDLEIEAVSSYIAGLK